MCLLYVYVPMRMSTEDMKYLSPPLSALYPWDIGYILYCLSLNQELSVLTGLPGRGYRHIWLCLIFSSKSKTNLTWVGDDNSVVICIGHSSQSPGSITGTHLQVSVTPIPGDPMISSGLWRHCMRVVHRYTWKEQKTQNMGIRDLNSGLKAYKAGTLTTETSR